MVDAQAYAKKLRQDYAKAFNTEWGQGVLRDLMSSYHIYGGISPDSSSNELFFREGQRQVVLYILDKLKEPLDPAKFMERNHQTTVDFHQSMT